MYRLDLGHLQAHLGILENPQEVRTPRLPFSLRDNLQTSCQQFGCTLPYDVAGVTEGDKDLLKNEPNVLVEVCSTIPSKLFQDKNACMSALL